MNTCNKDHPTEKIELLNATLLDTFPKEERNGKEAVGEKEALAKLKAVKD